MHTYNDSPVYNILMYSHDTHGLGHIRRNMAIANHLRDADTNVLILTGSPIAGRFQFPQQADFVRIPGMIKKTNDDYQSLSIRIEQEKALAVRTNIILATARTFQPNLFIADKEPLGLIREVLPTLEWFKESSPSTVTILGLRDHRLFVGTGFAVLSAMMFTVVVFRLGAERSTVSLLAIFLATILLLVSAILILIYKKKVKDSLLETANRTPSWGRRRFASLWHVPAVGMPTVG
jgi:hypothetical protein